MKSLAIVALKKILIDMSIVTCQTNLWKRTQIPALGIVSTIKGYLTHHFQDASTVALLAQLLGTVYTRFAPDSYVTAPLLSTLINLYSKLVPAGRLRVVVHRGFGEVYLEADNAGAFAVFQLPSCAMEPAIFTVCPTTVVVLELKVTATVATGVAHPAAAVVDVAIVVEDALVALGAAEETLLVVGGGLEPDAPVILISAHVKYTRGVWKEFHLNESSVWFDT
jgi:hypothetical protein